MRSPLVSTFTKPNLYCGEPIYNNGAQFYENRTYTQRQSASLSLSRGKSYRQEFLSSAAESTKRPIKYDNKARTSFHLQFLGFRHLTQPTGPTEKLIIQATIH